MKFIAENKTFSLVLIALLGAVVLMALGKIPQIVTVGDYTTLAGILIGIYATKSGVTKFVKKGDTK